MGSAVAPVFEVVPPKAQGDQFEVVPPKQESSADTGVWAGVKRNTVGMVQGLYHAFTDPITDTERAELKQKVDSANEKAKAAHIPQTLYTDPTPAQLAYHRLVDAPAEELELKGQNERAAARDLLGHGEIVKSANQYLSGVSDTLLAKVPMLGPTINNVAQRYESGDKSGAAVDMTALMAPDIVKGMKQFQPLKTLLPSGTPEKLYESALKPSTTIPEATRAKMVETGLQNEIPITKSGVEKLGDLVDDLNDKTKQIIDQANKQGATINKYAVASRLNDAYKRFATQVNPESDLGAVSESGNEFLRGQPNEIPAAQAQALKSGTYTQLRGKYGELGSATIESQKALARGIKEELIGQFPELKNLGQNEGALLQLQPILERAVNRIANHQIIGIGTPIAAGATKAVTGSTGLGAIAGLMKAVIDDPMVKSRLAIALSRAGTPQPNVLTRLGAYSVALGNAASGEKNADQEGRQ